MDKTIISSVIVSLVLGVAIGSIAFPRTTIQTTTQTTTTTQIITYQVTESMKNIPVVTLTAIKVLVFHYVATCTTVSGRPFVTYTSGPGGQTTTVVTTYGGTLPQEYVATITTESGVSASLTTYPFTGSC
jgi:hypothetical protein